MNQSLSEAGQVWDRWSSFLDKMLPSLNLQQGLNWWERENFYRLIPSHEKTLDRYITALAFRMWSGKEVNPINPTWPMVRRMED